MKTTLRIIALAALSLVLVGADDCNSHGADAQRDEMAMVTRNQERLQETQPVPSIDRSAERENQIRRVELWNDTNKISYIYLISHGQIMAFFTVQGKVSSLNTFLTTSEQVIFHANGNVAVESPDLDGTYGSNREGIFFFTTERVYIEWPGEYLLSDQPLQLSQPPIMVMPVDGNMQATQNATH